MSKCCLFLILCVISADTSAGFYTLESTLSGASASLHVPSLRRAEENPQTTTLGFVKDEFLEITQLHLCFRFLN